MGQAKGDAKRYSKDTNMLTYWKEKVIVAPKYAKCKMQIHPHPILISKKVKIGKIKLKKSETRLQAEMDGKIFN
jgi:hypothetical protein